LQFFKGNIYIHRKVTNIPVALGIYFNQIPVGN